MDDRRATDAPTSDTDDGEPEQPRGQGEGAHEPTIEPEPPAAEPRTYSERVTSDVDEPDAPLAREAEGMDRRRRSGRRTSPRERPWASTRSPPRRAPRSRPSVIRARMGR